MIRLTLSGPNGGDLSAIAAEFGRDEESGELISDVDGDRFLWRGPTGRAFEAQGPAGAFSQDGTAVTGLADRIDIALDGGGTLGLLALAPSFDLAYAAAFDRPLRPFVAFLAGDDQLLANSPGSVSLDGEGISAPDGALAGNDLIQSQGGGARLLTGDWRLMDPAVYEAVAGADRIQVSGEGDISVWGDVRWLLDRAVLGGAGLQAAPDLIDAERARGGVNASDNAVLIGDVGQIGRGWVVEGGDDEIRGPRGWRAVMIGDALTLGEDGALIGGDDEIRGGRGDDAIYGDVQSLEAGSQRLTPGADSLYGGGGNDEIWGDRRYSEGTLELDDSHAGDLIEGGRGDDSLHGGWGDDDLRGQAGADRLFGESGADLLQGGGGADLLRGGRAADRLLGGGGDDALRGDGGSDTLQGGRGGDALSGGRGADLLEGQGGADKLSGGTGADLLRGGGGADKLAGGAGGDRLEGGGGADKLKGGAGADKLFGQGGGDRLVGGADADLLDGGGGDDRLVGQVGDDELLGQKGADRLEGWMGRDRLQGGRGKDWLEGGAEADLFLFAPGDGKDRIVDFEPGVDDLELLDGLAPLKGRVADAGARLVGDGVSILLEGVSLSDLRALEPDWLQG